ncbi:IS4 family transposase [Dactylosporangium sp. CA-092794]|uniref:IS4 family transposase n=1 Tax=Dactylosporangium sp. CA-092794 TaxID=3239929 RepID=UPI003D943D89
MVQRLVRGLLTDWISLGVLASSVPRDVVDEVVAVTGRAARRSGGKLPPHVVVYFVMALALFADEDYEEVAARLAETLLEWGCWDGAWSVPTSGGLTQARQRLGSAPVVELFDRVAVPVASELTRGAWLGPWRLMAIDGFEWDAPDSEENAARFGFGSGGAALSKVRVVTVSECGSHAVVAAGVGRAGQGELTVARGLLTGLGGGWLLLADRNFYSLANWNAARRGGTQLLWRVKSGLLLPVLRELPDGSYRSVLINPKIQSRFRRRDLQAAAAAGAGLDPDEAVVVRVVEYTVPDRGSSDREPGAEVIRLITTIVDPAAAAATQLAAAYHDRWEHETGNDQLKTHLRGPGRVLRSKSPDLVVQEIYGYLLTHYAISALICHAATEAGIDPDRVKFLRTVRIVRRRIDDPAAFSP